MAPKIERITENCILAEGSYWDEETQSLYFVDIIGNTVHRYNYETQKCSKAAMGTINGVSLIIPIKGEKNKFVVTVGRELVTVNWDGESDVTIVKKLTEIENPPDSLGIKFNDGKCDASGRLWLGAMGTINEQGMEKEKCCFYSYENNKLTTVLTKISISNGLAFNYELKKCYYIDSGTSTIDEFDFDIEKGIIANRKAIFTLSKHELPGGFDGMTTDTDGNLWVAMFGGSRVIKIDPRIPETLLDSILLPAKQITSATFGGPNLDELYVTTACIPVGGETLSPPDNGAVYKITGLNAKGFPGVRIKL